MEYDGQERRDADDAVVDANAVVSALDEEDPLNDDSDEVNEEAAEVEDDVLLVVPAPR